MNWIKTFLNRLFAIFFLLLIFPEYSSALNLCAGIETNLRKAHIAVDLLLAPQIEFFHDHSLQQAASFRLDEHGLYFKDSLLCGWAKGSFYASQRPDRILESCPKSNPIKSGYGDYGVGTAVLCVQLAGRDNNIAWVEFNSKNYYFDLSALAQESWKMEAPDTEEEIKQRELNKKSGTC